MLQKIMVGPCGAKFLADCKRQKRAVFLWTVNEEKWMRWAVKKEVDAVLTDDPKKYLELLDDLREEEEASGSIQDTNVTVRDALGLLYINILVLFFGTLFRWRHGRTDRSKRKGKLQLKTQPQLAS